MRNAENSGQVPQIRIENHHTPIISREVWNLAQARMQQNNKHGSGGGGHSNRYVFSGKIKCGQCGASFVGRVKTLRDGSRVRRWSCGTVVRAGSAGCGIGRLVRDDDAMQMLHTAVRNLRLDVQGVIGNVAALALDAMLEGGDRRGGTRRSGWPMNWSGWGQRGARRWTAIWRGISPGRICWP